MTEEIQIIKLSTKKYNVESQSLRATLKDIPSIYEEYVSIFYTLMSKRSLKKYGNKFK